MADRPMRYLIWSTVRLGWWRPEGRGYTAAVEDAGRYSREDAIETCAHCRDGFTSRRHATELPVRECDAINPRGRSIAIMVLKADRAECRARDLSKKGKEPLHG